MKKAITGIAIMILIGFSTVSSGASFELSKKGTGIVIKGTSSLHNWEMILKTINCEVQFNQEGSLVRSIDNITFSCKAKDIKSESNLMDSKAYAALKADAFPEIKFTLISTTGLVSDGKKFNGNLKGKLNIAGETRDVMFPFNGNYIDSNTIEITGSADLSMSSFNITPPTAMLGALKTGDKISVSFNLQFIQKTQ
jgi:polyisoprenoid-binding protein YceI